METPGGPATKPPRVQSRALRVLAWFWGAVAAVVGAGVIALLIAGPPPKPPAVAVLAVPPPATRHAETAPPAEGASADTAHSPEMPPPASATATPAPAAASTPEPAVAAARPAMHETVTQARPEAAPAVIAKPLKALLEVSIGYPGWNLPRIGPSHLMPMDAYAAPADPAVKGPRIAILLGAIGQSEAASEDAARTLPAAVSFIVSPYTRRPDLLLDTFRTTGHEMFLGLPMEPQGYPVNDEGNQSLLTGVPEEQNQRRLEWAMSRIEGYVGATNALDGLLGERFVAATAPLGAVLNTLAQRGLMYLDAAPDLSRMQASAVAKLPVRSIDLVIDEPAVRSEIDAKLRALEDIATRKGSAVALAKRPLPIVLDRLADWSKGLRARGIALVPASSLIRAGAATAAGTSGKAGETPRDRAPDQVPEHTQDRSKE